MERVSRVDFVDGVAERGSCCNSKGARGGRCWKGVGQIDSDSLPDCHSSAAATGRASTDCPHVQCTRGKTLAQMRALARRKQGK